MVELPGESVLFVRVKPGYLEKAVKELKRLPSVSKAEPVLGPYDIVVTGTFRQLEALRKFTEEVEAKDFVEGCSSSPSFEQWIRPGAKEHEMSAWSLIRAVNADRAMKELQRIPAVNRVYTTAGEFNVVANISADRPQQLLDTVAKEIHKIREVRRTETLTGIPEMEE